MSLRCFQRVGVVDAALDRHGVAAIGIRRKAGDNQRTVAYVNGQVGIRVARIQCLQLRQSHFGAADGDAAQAIAGCEVDAAAGGGLVVCRGVGGTSGQVFFIHRGVAIHNAVSIHRGDAGTYGAVVIAGDGDFKCGCCRLTPLVLNGVVEDFSQRLARNQLVYLRMGLIQRVGIAAVRIYGQRTVLASNGDDARICILGPDCGAVLDF